MKTLGDVKAQTINMSEIARLARDGRERGLAKVEGELKTFELLFGVSTKVMRDEVVRGVRPETEEICAWLMVDNRRRALISK